ncbi:endothelial zinc finger protein induced by tumor necrosis factor alpha-like [Limanda limanda]|uniref:endothelial zinc finger protein induced by tumor necrosis factor alpha-like n=1 Tax=Limanda limanda TaxID=27771 RepID=UPI0029C8946B|nr:endothelial zinc finger protein induced by tumor necrosis factor alpha-like [Limanda limanda]
MSSGLVAPPGGGGELCEWRREVGCQWECPQQDTREVGCQSDSAPRRDAGVQVDLMRHLASPAASPAMLLQCFSVRSDGAHGGALLQHCTSTRTRTIRPAIRLSPNLTESRTQRRPPSADTTKPNPPPRRRRRRRRESPDSDPEEEVEDTADPNWTPPADGGAPSPPAPGGGGADPGSRHVKLELESIMCDVCGKVMKNKSSLARHSFIHTGKKPFACQLCDLRFNRRDNLQHHLTRLHPNGVSKLEKQREVTAWLCAVCGKTFNCRSRLKAHEVVHSGVKPHRCDLCPKAYMRTNDLEHHKKSVHVPGAFEPPRPSSLLCDLCGKEFKCRSQLVIHFQTHTGERPHLCDTCGRKFARQHQLKRHKILIHAKQRRGEENSPCELPFACSVCGKRLKSKALLAAHGHTHTSEKPHRCGVCLRSFQRATCLKQHHLRVHLKVRVNNAPHAARYRKCTAQAKMFPCPICSKVFKFKSLLSSHSLIHSELRPFACDFCSRSFRRLSHLKRHREVVHANGARPPQSFICHICGKDKKCRSQLDRHVIIHTGERPFACGLCSARFNRSGNLQQHRKRMHGVGKPPPSEEAPPILFDDDMTCKQEETVVAVDAAAERFEVALMEEMETEVVQELVAS